VTATVTFVGGLGARDSSSGRARPVRYGRHGPHPKECADHLRRTEAQQGVDRRVLASKGVWDDGGRRHKAYTKLAAGSSPETFDSACSTLGSVRLAEAATVITLASVCKRTSTTMQAAECAPSGQHRERRRPSIMTSAGDPGI
jgi:hypothetical protein